jgi:DNA-binding NarL/FixJ family response regulator
MDKTIKVLVADDHPIFRHGLCQIIQAERGFSLIGEAENGEFALQVIAEKEPDVVLLDLDMPVLDGIDCAKFLQKNFPHIKVVFLTMHKDRHLLNMMKPLNIKGYVLKDCAVIEILDCIQKVTQNQIYISPALTEMLLGEIASESGKQNVLSLIALLTPTEKRIIRLISESKTSRQIADELFVSLRTIENHRFNICTKLNINGNHSLVKFSLTEKQNILKAIPKADLV